MHEHVDNPELGTRPIALWRSWRVRDGFLVPPMWDQDDPWAPGEIVAACGKYHERTAPDPHCTCGWYGYYQPTGTLLPHPRDRDAVLNWPTELEGQSRLAAALGVSISQLYMWHHRLCARMYDTDGVMVDGVVMVWGKVELHTTGARAEWAQPWGLLTEHLNPTVATVLRERYAMVASDDWHTLLRGAGEWGTLITPDAPEPSGDPDR
jgi:hypothetical protein